MKVINALILNISTLRYDLLTTNQSLTKPRPTLSISGKNTFLTNMMEDKKSKVTSHYQP